MEWTDILLSALSLTTSGIAIMAAFIFKKYNQTLDDHERRLRTCATHDDLKELKSEIKEDYKIIRQRLTEQSADIKDILKNMPRK